MCPCHRHQQRRLPSPAIPQISPSHRRYPNRRRWPGPILPPVIDKELLVDAEKELGLSLRPYQEAREWLRDAFWERVHREFGISLGKSRSLY